MLRGLLPLEGRLHSSRLTRLAFRRTTMTSAEYSTSDAELLFLPDNDELRFLPEGPTVIAPGQFSWVAIQHGPQATRGSLNLFDVSHRVNRSFELPGRPGFAKPTTVDGVFVVGCERELGTFDTRDQSWLPLAGGVDADVQGTIINDGTLFKDNIVFGCKDLEFKTKKAGLYLYRGSDARLLQLRNDQVCSNGKIVLEDAAGQTQLIDIDSPTRKVVRYQLDSATGRLSEPETVIDLTSLEGVPDGMAATPDLDVVIISFYNPNPAEYGETHAYELSSGRLRHVWRTPLSPQATCPVLLPMPDGSVKLIITTAVEHMPSDRRQQSSNAGGIFIADTTYQAAPTLPPWPLAGR
jgi:sugar lactone lactonase YvrE